MMIITAVTCRRMCGTTKRERVPFWWRARALVRVRVLVVIYIRPTTSLQLFFVTPFPTVVLTCCHVVVQCHPKPQRACAMIGKFVTLTFCRLLPFLCFCPHILATVLVQSTLLAYSDVFQVRSSTNAPGAAAPHPNEELTIPECCWYCALVPAATDGWCLLLFLLSFFFIILFIVEYALASVISSRAPHICVIIIGTSVWRPL